MSLNQLLRDTFYLKTEGYTRSEIKSIIAIWEYRNKENNKIPKKHADHH